MVTGAIAAFVAGIIFLAVQVSRSRSPWPAPPPHDSSGLTYKVGYANWFVYREAPTRIPTELAVSIAVLNNGLKPAGLQPGDIKLVDEQGAEYQASNNNGSFTMRNTGPYGLLNPHESTGGVVSFTAPTGHHYWLQCPVRRLNSTPRSKYSNRRCRRPACCNSVAGSLRHAQNESHRVRNPAALPCYATPRRAVPGQAKPSLTLLIVAFGVESRNWCSSLLSASGPFAPSNPSSRQAVSHPRPSPAALGPICWNRSQRHLGIAR